MSSLRAIAIGKAIGGGGGGGGDITVEALTATENKIYRAPSGKAYSPVTVNVPQGENIPVLLTVTTPPTKTSYEQGDTLDLTGIVVTATYADGTTANVTNNCTFSPADGATMSTVGDQTITATYTVTDTSTGHNYTLTLTATTSVTVTAPAFVIVPFASGTDEQIAAMIDAAHEGTIDLQQDGNWAVGDVRTIVIQEFEDGAGTTHAQQSIDIVITSFDDYMSCGNVLQFDFKDCVTGGARINASNINGYAASEMKTLTLPALVNALPDYIKNRLIEFSVLGSKGGSQSSTIETVTGNKLALRSCVELGNAGSSASGEGIAIQYYVDNGMGKGGDYWTRSPYYNGAGKFICVKSSGSMDWYYSSSSTPRLAPFGCL